MVEVRIATTADARGILEIYAPHIISTAYTFETEVPTVEQMGKRIESCLQKFPWIVCSVNGTIAGYVYASGHRDREAYQWSGECSVYIHESFKGKGIGSTLYPILFEILRTQGMRNIYAGITLPNDASVGLHHRCGFEQFAVYNQVGYKLGRWHNVGWWRLRLNEFDPQPSPPVKFSALDHQAYSGLFGPAALKIQSRIKD